MKTQIVRHPDGQWVGIAAIPIGNQLFTIKEIVDERPFRAEALRRVASTLVPHAQAAGCIGAEPGTPQADLMWRAILAARKAANALIDKSVREKLLQKLGYAIRRAADIAAKAYQTGKKQVAVIGGTMNLPTDKLQAIVNRIVRSLAINDSRVYPLMVSLGDGVLRKDTKSRTMLESIIYTATWGEAGRTLRNIFTANPRFAPIVRVIDGQVHLHRHRVLAGASR